MMRGLVLAGAMSVLATGCLLDRSVGDRPARFHAGPNMRVVNMSSAAGQGPAGNPTTPARSSSPTGGTTTSLDHMNAVSAALQFTMQTAGHTYVGGEVETGTIGKLDGSNLAGAYGVVGAEAVAGLGSLGVELATGWQALRTDWDSDADNRLIFEPRVRGQLWLAEQWTIGGEVGARLGGGGEWVGGVYLGVHSTKF